MPTPNLLPMNGHHAANIPLLGQVKPDIWQCANGHQFTGDPPRIVFPLSPTQGITVTAICLFCFGNAMQALYPVFRDAPLVPPLNGDG